MVDLRLGSSGPSGSIVSSENDTIVPEEEALTSNREDGVIVAERLRSMEEINEENVLQYTQYQAMISRNPYLLSTASWDCLSGFVSLELVGAIRLGSARARALPLHFSIEGSQNFYLRVFVIPSSISD